RDLPKSTLGVDVEHDFLPKYIVPMRSRKHVQELKTLAKKSSSVLFATDEDREGEAISWHLAEILGIPPDKAERIVFHEITSRAIQEALKKPRPLDLHLVDAQQARRVLDRLVGYTLSPFLWKKVARGLSAGRVQSVAVRLIVERERERQAFKAQDYWTIEGLFHPENATTTFPARLYAIASKTLEKLEIASQEAATEILSKLRESAFHVSAITKKTIARKPAPPYTTSTLQQDANHLLGFSSKQTMLLAQQLYEGVDLGPQARVGLITYMRTDSVNLAKEFVTEARTQISRTFGKPFMPEAPREWVTKSKLAQEAHEAIRPTSAMRKPDSMSSYLSPQQLKLYTLIWNRALASQMENAKLARTAVDIVDGSNGFTFRANGSTILFPGFLTLYPSSIKETLLPELNEGDKISAEQITAEKHTTEPPARFTEAMLVKTLEEKGIGRPSTYAPTMSTIQERGYVTLEEKCFAPTEIGMLVNDVLVEHFPDIVDYDFTANLEDSLDAIAGEGREWIPIIRDFYTPFKQRITEKEQEVSKKALTEEATSEVCEKCGKPMVIKMGRFGRFLACTGFPECKNTKQLSKNGEIEPPETTTETCDKCGKPMVVKIGRFGKFLGCSGYPDCKGIKKIETTTGVRCPQCNKGDIVEKRSRRGKMFYSCNRYPTCKFALWSRPTGSTCQTCGSLMVQKNQQSEARCSNPECVASRATEKSPTSS
ncbi:MAG: type I DNA topoisomerase, partial [Candidatus Kerfeldbacteria bacterium]|nr:type I DNA topoisomerase [Candidatus Kerfeldbacteria bacterium]